MGSDPRSKVIVSVAIASCVIGTVGYLKYVQSEGNVSHDCTLFTVNKDAQTREHICNLAKLIDWTLYRKQNYRARQSDIGGARNCW